MKICCPKCNQVIPSADVNVGTSVAYCLKCEEGFSLAALSADDGPPRTAQPAVPCSSLNRVGDVLTLALPRGGVRGLGCFLLFFSLFWNGITWMVFGTMLYGMFALGKPKVRGHVSGPAMLLFSLPFVFIGVITFCLALFNIFGRCSLVMDRDRGIYRQEMFGFKWDTKFSMREISAVQMMVAYTQNDRPVYTVGILREHAGAPGTDRPWESRILFGTSLPEEERHWLCGEINAFWREMTKRRTVEALASSDDDDDDDAEIASA